MPIIDDVAKQEICERYANYETERSLARHFRCTPQYISQIVRSAGLTDGVYRRPKPTTCKVENCDRPVSCRGYCSFHYRNFRQHGDPEHTEMPRPVSLSTLLARSTFVPETECWLLSGKCSKGGYIRVGYQGKSYYAHRLAKSFAVGYELPKNVQVRHTCGNLRCINPEHLRINHIGKESQ